MKKILFVTSLSFILLRVPAWGQPGSLHLGMVIDMESAKTLSSGGIEAELRMYPEGGLLTSLLVGVTSRFNLGVSYGGENIIGTGKVDLNPRPCVHIRFLILEERFFSPAFMIGFNDQGYGRYDKGLKRYTIKSRGLYAVLSKNTSFLGGMGFHLGVNWSLENEDEDSDPNFFVGCHKRLNADLVLLGEYDIANNDNSGNAIGSGQGYLNCGVRWSFAQRLFVEFAWKNILENTENVDGSSREVKLVYVTYL